MAERQYNADSASPPRACLRPDIPGYRDPDSRNIAGVAATAVARAPAIGGLTARPAMEAGVAPGLGQRPLLAALDPMPRPSGASPLATTIA